MINFFRKIRKSLFSENQAASPAGRFSKYLIYAIGEIVLVVVGILIALQINNWKDIEDRKLEITEIYLSIIDELESDNQKLETILPEFEWKTKTMRKIIVEDLSVENWITNDSLFDSFNAFPDFRIGQERFQLLKTKIALNETTRAINNKIADFYKKHNTDISVITNEANMSYHRNIKYWEENEPWFATAIIKRDFRPLGEYAVQNPIFKNKIVWYRIMLLRLKNGLKSYKKESQALIREITAAIEELNK